jgi:hypothetical protein
VRGRLAAIALITGLTGMAGCSTIPSPTSAPVPSPSSTATAAPRSATPPKPTSTPTPGDPATAPSATTAVVAEPTTTNTLPPPPRPSRPAPSVAGELSAASLPVPAGWRTVVRAGGSEEGYEGNGTWVHARDPRYAANDVLAIGCAMVTRDDYADPTHALEGTYVRDKDESGIGLVLQFGTANQARAFYTLYVQQVRACRGPDGPVTTRVLSSGLGLIDRRRYPDGDWTEVGALEGSRLTLVILSDTGHRISAAQSEALLRQIRAR